jgi:hypothetical protein
MTYARLFTLIFILALPSIAIAQENATFFGFEVGADTVQSARTKATEKGLDLKNAGINKYSDGPMITVDAKGMDVKGVRDFLLIFDKQELLQAIVLDTRKNHFEMFEEFLASKYQLVKRQVPFVGDKFTKFSAPNAVIELSAPHMGFNMNMTYASEKFLQAFDDKLKEEQARKSKNAASQF